jgi:hypothetical protein
LRYQIKQDSDHDDTSDETIEQKKNRGGQIGGTQKEENEYKKDRQFHLTHLYFYE